MSSDGATPQTDLDGAWRRGRAFLQRRGLPLTALLDCTATGPAFKPLRDAGIDPSGYCRLLLVANAGPRFWRALRADRAAAAGPDPVDTFSRAVAERLCRDYLRVEPRPLFPGPTAAAPPLQQLGALAGWHRPSPLGVGIHPRYGLWFAYRLALLIDAPLPADEPRPAAPSPCARCVAKPCLNACPGGALNADRPPSMPRCVDYRLSASSACTARCLARLACPVAADRRYPAEQTDYHYRRSLNDLRDRYG